MKLLCSLTSPYARKVRMLALERGIDLPLEIVDVFADPLEFLQISPQGKVPVLLLNNGQAVYDSRVICEYLDVEVGSTRLSIEAMVREALAESMVDASLPVVLERRRPESQRSEAMVARQFDRIGRILGAFEKLLAEKVEGPLSRVQIGVAVALGYLDFRLPDLGWRQEYSGLVAWFSAIESRESFKRTRPPSA